MDATVPMIRVEKTDAQAVKQWAAEDFAISIGLLCECPYHGEPFKAHRKSLADSAFAAGLIDPLDPVIQVFQGDRGELMAAVERVTGGYGERCGLCVASEGEDFD
ncbi:MAG TPA: hypothetical protein VD867_00080 [Burkholderiales bacterium]|nr:hypothetical protein [Burkholderiales bacterium]